MGKRCGNKVSVDRNCQNNMKNSEKKREKTRRDFMRESERERERLNMVISGTFNVEGALGGPQVQLSQAERHLTDKCNPTQVCREGQERNK